MTHDDISDADIRIAKLEKSLIQHDGIIIAELDGFIAALWLLPEEPKAEAWVPYVFGWGKDAEFVADADLVKLVSDHYSGVGYELRSGTYQPVYMIGDDEEVDWAPWIDGFAAVVGLYPDAFQAVVSAETEAGEALRMLVALAGVAMGDDEVAEEMGAEAIAELSQAAPDLIPECLYTVYDARLEASGALQPRTVTATGRNDPCPCGSGKKFKKCCGAAA